MDPALPLYKVYMRHVGRLSNLYWEEYKFSHKTEKAVIETTECPTIPVNFHVTSLCIKINTVSWIYSKKASREIKGTLLIFANNNYNIPQIYFVSKKS